MEERPWEQGWRWAFRNRLLTSFSLNNGSLGLLRVLIVASSEPGSAIAI